MSNILYRVSPKNWIYVIGSFSRSGSNHQTYVWKCHCQVEFWINPCRRPLLLARTRKRNGSEDVVWWGRSEKRKEFFILIMKLNEAQYGICLNFIKKYFFFLKLTTKEMTNIIIIILTNINKMLEMKKSWIILIFLIVSWYLPDSFTPDHHQLVLGHWSSLLSREDRKS